MNKSPYKDAWAPCCKILLFWDCTTCSKKKGGEWYLEQLKAYYQHFWSSTVQRFWQGWNAGCGRSVALLYRDNMFCFRFLHADEHNLNNCKQDGCWAKISGIDCWNLPRTLRQDKLIGVRNPSSETNAAGWKVSVTVSKAHNSGCSFLRHRMSRANLQTATIHSNVPYHTLAGKGSKNVPQPI